jgi:hypothetical protein
MRLINLSFYRGRSALSSIFSLPTPTILMLAHEEIRRANQATLTVRTWSLQQLGVGHATGLRGAHMANDRA